MNIEQRIKEIEDKSKLNEIDYDENSVTIAANLVSDLAKKALEVINYLQSEVERYKSLDEWQDISSAPHFEQVLVFYKNCFDNPRIVIARYLPEGTECQCSNDCDCRYDDEKDIYVQEGWYEQIDNWGHYSEVAINEGEPTHWRPLPKPPEQNH